MSDVISWIAYHGGPYWDAFFRIAYWPLMAILAVYGAGAIWETIRLTLGYRRASRAQRLQSSAKSTSR